jgi:flavin reductase (DIM6/NTAB) family NADH-FMN oxidoreductase RutF
MTSGWKGGSSMKIVRKKDLPVAEVRRYMEPGPIVLVTSHWKEESNVMTMGWHTVMEFAPSLIGCIIASGNHSHELIRKSRQCVINIPTATMLDQVVGIGNCSGTEVDKFARFDLQTAKAEQVDAPLLTQCFANLECRLHDKSLIGKYNFFIFEVVKAHVARTPKYPQTVHYTGDGIFTLSGKTVSRRAKFRSEML